jgi:hypothetical protein
MENIIEKSRERLNAIAWHFVRCPHCENCKKQEFLIQAIDNIRGELERALLPNTLPLLYTEPMARAKIEKAKSNTMQTATQIAAIAQ